MAAHRQHRAARDVGHGMNDLALLAYRRGECRGSSAPGPVASRCAVALAAAISFARRPRALLVGWYQVERAGAGGPGDMSFAADRLSIAKRAAGFHL